MMFGVNNRAWGRGDLGWNLSLKRRNNGVNG